MKWIYLILCVGWLGAAGYHYFETADDLSYAYTSVIGWIMFALTLMAFRDDRYPRINRRW